MPDDRMTMRDIDRLKAADEVVIRSKTPRPSFRLYRNGFEEYATVFAVEWWQQEALFQAQRAASLEKRIRELQADSMSMGEPD